MKKVIFLFFLVSFFPISISFAATSVVNKTVKEIPAGKNLFNFKDLGFVINSSASEVIGEKGSKRLQLILQHPVALIISESHDNPEIGKISLVPSGLEDKFLLDKKSDFYIGNRDNSPDAYLMFVDEQGKKTAERVDIEKIEFASGKATAVVELESEIPGYLVGTKNAKSMGLFVVSEVADITSDTAVYSRGNAFGALMFDLLDQQGETARVLLKMKKKHQ